MVRKQETMPLVNHAFVLVIFVVFLGSEQQSPCFTGWNANSSFSPFSSKPLFLARDKGTVYQKHLFLMDPKMGYQGGGIVHLCGTAKPIDKASCEVSQ